MSLVQIVSVVQYAFSMYESDAHSTSLTFFMVDVKSCYVVFGDIYVTS